MRHALLLAIALGLILILACSCQPIVDTAEAAEHSCDLAGSWIGSFSGGPWDDPLIFQSAFVPLDKKGDRYQYTIYPANPDATFKAPPFADADYMTPMVGQAVRTGPDTFDFSIIGYSVNDQSEDRGQILFAWTADGIITCSEDGSSFEQSSNLAIIPAEADTDMDGLPDEGAEPPVCLTTESTFGSAKRLPILPPCEPEAE